jgi:PAS domain S-box-containing protein
MILLVYKDASFVHIAVLSVIVAECTNVIIWFLSKKYREELEAKVILGALKTMQDRYIALVENSLVGIYVFDATGKIEYVNQTLSRLLGYRPFELIGKNIFDLVYLDDVPTVKKNVTKRLEGDVDLIKYNLRMFRKDGTIAKVTVMGSLTRNGHDTISGTLILAE